MTWERLGSYVCMLEEEQDEHLGGKVEVALF